MVVRKIKNIITAIGNPILNCELKKLEKFNVLNNDILYQEGILEILDSNDKIDFLILSQLLPGQFCLDNLIEEIKNNNKKIKIIIILEEFDENLEIILNKQGVFRIIYNNKIEIKDIITILKEDEKMEKYNEEIRKEIDELKEYILKNKEREKNKKTIINNFYKNLKNKIVNINYKKKKIIKNNMDNFNQNSNKNNIEKNIENDVEKNKKNTIISVLGNNGSGKSVISIIMANYYKKYNDKILIIDFDILNNSLHTLLGVSKYSEKIKKIINENNFNNYFQKSNEVLLNNIKENNVIEKLIIKINKKIDLISGINLIFDKNGKINQEKIKEIINILKNKYEKIIIDTSSECYFDYTQELIKISDINIFLTEANLVELSKSKRILDIYYNDWKIEKNKIKIIFNKFNENSININLLKKLYSDYEIIGKIKINNLYNSLINCNFKNLFINNKIIKKNNIIFEKLKLSA